MSPRCLCLGSWQEQATGIAKDAKTNRKILPAIRLWQGKLSDTEDIAGNLNTFISSGRLMAYLLSLLRFILLHRKTTYVMFFFENLDVSR